MKRFVILYTALVTNALLISGCNLQDIRGFFQETPVKQGASLEIRVKPERHIRVYINGDLKGRRSPVELTDLDAGTYLIKVTALGYEAVQMPVVLKDGTELSIPIQLTPKPAQTKVNNIKESKSPTNSAKSSNNVTMASTTTSMPKAVIENIQPVSLKLAIMPPGPVYMNDEIVGHGETVNLTITKPRGRLEVGAHKGPRSLIFEYKLMPHSKLYLRPVGELDRWKRNGMSVRDKHYPVGISPQRYEVFSEGRLSRAVIIKRQ